MNNTIGQRIQSRHFDLAPATKEFIAEMSMIQHGGFNPLEQLYVDEGTRGFVLVRDGKELAFELSDVQRDADHDTRYWEFKLAAHSAFANPELQGARVVILND